MKSHLPMMFFSGTLGDAFIALCKLYNHSTNAPIGLRRMCRHGGVDDKITQLTSLFPNVFYNEDFISFCTIAEMRDFAFNNSGAYLNIFYDGCGRGAEPDDPPGFEFNPAPKLPLSPFNHRNRDVVIGINLQSGARNGYQRQICLDWVEELCGRLNLSSRIGVRLLGTGVGYSDYDLNRIRAMMSCSVQIEVGTRDLLQGLRNLIDLDFLISADGLIPFFALSQKVPCYILYTDKTAILRMHQAWRTLAVCDNPITVVSNTAGEVWKGSSAASLVTQLLARFDPDALS